MTRYIATFFSHFGAMRFFREREASGCHAKLSPVPRALSSSCGTCVVFDAADDFVSEKTPFQDPHGEVEQLVVPETDDTGAISYRVLYHAGDNDPL